MPFRRIICACLLCKHYLITNVFNELTHQLRWRLLSIVSPWPLYVYITHDGKRFLLFSDGDADKMVVFSTEDQLRLLQEADTIYMDDDARFPLRMWNHFTNAGPRTNNNVEGFHSRVNRLLPHRHPNIYRFVELIKGIEKCERAKLIQINAGAPPPPRRRVYRELDTRDRRFKQQLTDRTKTPLQYLDAIGHLMKLQWVWYCGQKLLNCWKTLNKYF